MSRSDGTLVVIRSDGTAVVSRSDGAPSSGKGERTQEFPVDPMQRCVPRSPPRAPHSSRLSGGALSFLLSRGVRSSRLSGGALTSLLIAGLLACGRQERPAPPVGNPIGAPTAEEMVYAGEPPLVWAIDRDTALVDGTITVTLRRSATEAPPDPRSAVRPALVIRCEEGKTEVFVTVPAGLVGEEHLKGAPVSVTFDSLLPVKERWFASERGDAVFSPGADAFLAQLKLTDTVHLRVRVRDSVTQVSSFAVVGLSEPLRRLAPECEHANWPVSPTTIN